MSGSNDTVYTFRYFLNEWYVYVNITPVTYLD
jgi:hypothetical protein